MADVNSQQVPCHSPAQPSPINRYVDSIQRILEYIGLPVPHTHPVFPPLRLNRHLYSIDLPGKPASATFSSTAAIAEWFLSDEHAACNVYLEHEKSKKWSEFLKGLPPTDRHEASVRRCITMMIFSSLRRHRCVYCWLPVPSCMCGELERMRCELLQPLQRVAIVTMLLHSEEVLRTTNTGHIAAFLLDGEIRVWGIAQDDSWLAQVVHNDASNHSNDGIATHPVLLYPEDGAQLISDVFAVASPITTDEAVDNDDDDSHRVDALRPPPPRLHLILSDGTWGQAHRVNRHVPRSIPRVALKIEDTYESLFVTLRKQTRTTGVSTLEATALAVSQRMTSLGQQEDAALVDQHLLSTMKKFVDVVCVDKRQEPVFNVSEAPELKQRRREHHQQMMDTERAAGKRNDEPERHVDEALFLALRAPPVLSYCYVCEMYIGWSRMPGHVVGVRHQQLVTQLPPGTQVWDPPAASRTAKATNFHVLNGKSVPLQS